MSDVITVATLLWAPNGNSRHFSRMYDESWVEKLYRGFARNLTVPFRFVCFVDRLRTFREPIEQELLWGRPISYGSCIEPYRLGVPMILVGLDTIVVGNVDHLARYCFEAKEIALPLGVYRTETVCNGVALVPAGRASIYDRWSGENDMDWLRANPHAVLDRLFPGEVVSYKGHVKKRGLGGVRIVFFHGEQKPHELRELPWVGANWS